MDLFENIPPKPIGIGLALAFNYISLLLYYFS